MKKFVYITVAVTVVLLAFYLLYKPEAKITNYPSSGTDIIAFGDSLVEGVGSTEDGGFVRMLSQDLRITIINLGVSGDTTQSALSRLGQISKYKPKVVIVLLGGNDFLQKAPEEQIFKNLDQIVVAIHRTGAVILLVGVEGHILTSGHEKLFRELAERRGTAYVPDILDDIFGQDDFMSDNLHPNDRGYRIMADRIKPVLEKML
ncbi:MAG: hypothetical protein A3G05_01930 [Candidatus Zambryskibacteria bacterium RIFCSPLOWO2_12_FULL_45_14]|uniref:SGNH hydrolase-type esterase domain-containing protein n=2 Tax=Candidatus Zambryskiibacteriota TaxID=1817925 RepID=A0A1G2ULF8_9BACT|nr:MAG: hypothetical protein A3H60_01850 [Candidatus Zambryskibacteria bacterium RIFCSPLOWO2_02_FULL_44_12b]OHB14110.1 MAG: hypothetical protein A3G05_01930 [Candidatus Zambryskibacteria bacterium RIFCSPLOWO2_12_FULL_45_14]